MMLSDERDNIDSPYLINVNGASLIHPVAVGKEVTATGTE
jgi:hypothetical protein